MFSKCVQPIGSRINKACKLNISYQPIRCTCPRNGMLLTNGLKSILYQPVRCVREVVPTNPKTPSRLNPFYAIRVYWELIPLVAATFTGVALIFLATWWAIKNKVDVVFTTHSRHNISRTMDLREPTVHKMVTINQRYTPWPEMQDVLDKMAVAEKRALESLESCQG